MAEEKKFEKKEGSHKEGTHNPNPNKEVPHNANKEGHQNPNPNREGGHRDEKREERRDEKAKVATSFPQSFRAQVEEMVGRTGMRGEAVQVRCKILDGRDSGKVMRRNVKGPVRIGDILMLRETETEAQKLKGGSRR